MEALRAELPGQDAQICDAVLVDELMLLNAAKRVRPSRAAVLEIVRASAGS